jgi:hypothetical protein
MIELILDNLGIVIFVVIAIAVRVLQARTRARQKEEAPPPVFVSGLEPDDDDDDDSGGARYRLDPDEALIDYARTRGASAHAAELAGKKITRLLEDRPPFAAFPGLSAGPPADRPAAGSPAEQAAPFTPAEKPPAASSADASFQAEPDGASPSGGAPKRPEKSGAFLPGPEGLSPLQQGVLWAEILGTPRGIV